MQETLLTYVLPVLVWGGITGIINLAFGYKSQIEAWAESHPRLAALLKFTRGIGLDPWHLLSALKLFAEKKLPDAQKSDSAIARSEQRKADAKRRDDEPPSAGGAGPWVDIDAKTPPSLPGVHRFVAIGWMLLLLPSCAGWKPVVRTTNDVARVLCGEFFGQKQGIDFEQAAEQFCKTRDDLAPWIEALVAAKREAEPKAAARHP